MTYTIVWSLALANVLGAGLCILLSPGIARLTTIRFALLAPFLFMMISFAAFQAKQTLWDLGALVAIGILGIFLRRFEWPRPAFLIGFVLASQAEVYTYQATQIAMSRFRRGFEDGFAYIFSPMAIILLVIIVASVWLGARQSKGMQPDDRPLNKHGKTAPMIFAGLIAAFLAVAVVDSFTISVFIDKVFPMTVAGFSLIGALVLLFQMNARSETDLLFNDGERHGEDASAPIGLWSTLAWFVSLLVLTALFGFVIALTLFFLAFLMVRASIGPVRALLLTTAGVGAVLIIASALNRDFPPGLLQEMIELPWPFGF